MQNAAEFQTPTSERGLIKSFQSIHPFSPQAWDAIFWEEKKAEWLIATLYIEIFNIHTRIALQKKPLNYGSRGAQLSHLRLSFMFYENFMSILSIDVPVLLNTCGNSEQRSMLVSHQLTQQRARAVLTGYVDQSTAPTHTCHILLRAARFIKNTIPWKWELWLKTAQRSRSSLKMTPSVFNLYFPWSWENGKVGLQVSLWGEIVV